MKSERNRTQLTMNEHKNMSGQPMHGAQRAQFVQVRRFKWHSSTAC